MEFPINEPQNPLCIWVFKDFVGEYTVTVFAYGFVMAKEKALRLVSTDDYTPTRFDLLSVVEQ